MATTQPTQTVRKATGITGLQGLLAGLPLIGDRIADFQPLDGNLETIFLAVAGALVAALHSLGRSKLIAKAPIKTRRAVKDGERIAAGIQEALKIQAAAEAATKPKGQASDHIDEVLGEVE